MNFGQAIEHLKAGQRVARAGWNGKGMFVFLNKGSVSSLENSTHRRPEPGDPFYEKHGEDYVHVCIGGVRHTLFDCGSEGTGTRMPNLNMRAAEDWEIAK